MDKAIIYEENPWWKVREAIKEDTHVKEAFSRKNKVIYNFDIEENSIFIGPRRSGKTTFFKLLIYDLLINKKVKSEDVLFISCEIFREYTEIIEILNEIKSKYIFLDEITFVEGWEKAIKFMLDQGRMKERTLIITGSSTAFLRKETFPGRNIKSKKFHPLDFFRFTHVFGSNELKDKLYKIKKIDELLPYSSEIFNLFIKYMECGGFPKPMFELMEEGRIKEENYEAIYSWFRGDMLKLGKSEEISKALISRLLETMTTPISYNSIGNYIGITHRIVREYIETLAILLYADFCYQVDIQKNIPIFRKEKKIYFLDPFIVKTFEKKIVGKQIVDESKLAEMILFDTLKLIDERVFVIRTNGETDFFVNGKKIEAKWAERVGPKNQTVVLSKKKFDSENNVFPLPLYIIFVLKDKNNFMLGRFIN